MSKEPYPIPGSKLWRVYCDDCGQPMRCTGPDVGQEHVCEECDPGEPPAPHTGLTPRQKSLTRRTDGPDWVDS